MRRVVLIVSVGLNLMLAGAAVHVCRKHAAVAESVGVPAAADDPAHADPIDQCAAVAPEAIIAPAVVTNRFRWQQLESEDYAQYVANLRSVGCPEKTIRDIVVADVEKLYARKSAAVPLRAGFWSSGTKRAAAARAQATAQTALAREKDELLRHLLGANSVEYHNGHSDDLIEQAIMRFVIGPASEDALRKVFSAMAKGEKLEGEITSEVKGVMLAEDDKAVAEINRRTQSELKRALTPGQFEEFTARAAAMEFADRELAYFHVTAGELRQIARIRADAFGLEDEKPLNLFGRKSETDAQKEEFRVRLKTYLGETRFAEFERSKDPAYRGVIDLSAQHNLSAAVAVKVYQVKQLADAGREELKADVSLGASEREGKWRELEESTRAAVQRLLGDSAFDEYLRRGSGNWMTNSGSLQIANSSLL